MINAILNLILNILFFVIKLILNIVMAVFPKFTLADSFATILNSFFELLDGASNFTYFMVGELTPTFITIIITLFTLKHVVLPVINFTRKVVIR